MNRSPSTVSDRVPLFSSVRLLAMESPRPLPSEFREASPYWNVRINNWAERMKGKTPVLEFQNGYGRFSPRMWFIAGRGEGEVGAYRGADVPVEHKELGEFQKARYALLIGERVMLED